MSAGQRYEDLLELRRRVSIGEARLVQVRLDRAAFIVNRVVEKKLAWHRREEFLPPELEWAQAYGERHLLTVAEDSLTFMVFHEREKSGHVTGRVYTVDRAWIQGSDWTVGARARRALRTYKESEHLRTVKRAEAEAARALKALREAENDLRAKRKAHRAKQDQARIAREQIRP